MDPNHGHEPVNRRFTAKRLRTEGSPRHSRLFGGLMVLADDSPTWKWDPVEQAQSACRGGAAIVQLRAKHATDCVTLAWAKAIRELTRDCDALFYLNDRFDLALAADADGVHLGQEDLPPSRLPADARDRLQIGRSTHTLEQVKAACAEPIQYLAFGPVFGTRSKSALHAPRGIDLLAQVVEIAAPLPVIAIGGIGLDNAPRVAATGCAGFAVISAAATAADPVAAVRTLSDISRSRPPCGSDAKRRPWVD